MIICSVSTIPGRLSSLLIILEHLKGQTLKPDKLIITISKYYPRMKKYFSEQDLDKLNEYLHDYPIPFEIVKYEQDIGPTVKLLSPLSLSTLNKEEDIIVIMDDDSILYERTIELLYENYKTYGTSVYGMMGVIEDPKIFIHGENVQPYNFALVEVLGGYRGVLYPVHLIFDNLKSWVDTFVNEHSQQGLIAMHDDHIFSFFCEKNKIERRVIHIPNPNANGQLFYQPISNKDGIFNDNNWEISYKLTKQIYEGLALSSCIS